jgi:hypothetical protein
VMSRLSRARRLLRSHLLEIRKTRLPDGNVASISGVQPNGDR